MLYIGCLVVKLVNVRLLRLFLFQLVFILISEQRDGDWCKNNLRKIKFSKIYNSLFLGECVFNLCYRNLDQCMHLSCFKLKLSILLSAFSR